MPSVHKAHSGSITPSQRAHHCETTILLVDDDPAVLTLLDCFLTAEGYRVMAAPDPASALQIASSASFDLLVTDYQMPGMDGLSLAMQITSERAALPVLLISGADPEGLPMLELDARHWRFLPKPIDLENLVYKIDHDCLG